MAREKNCSNDQDIANQTIEFEHRSVVLVLYWGHLRLIPSAHEQRHAKIFATPFANICSLVCDNLLTPIFFCFNQNYVVHLCQHSSVAVGEGVNDSQKG